MEEYKYIPMEELEVKGSAHFSTQKKGQPASALLVDQITSIQTEELKHILSAISQEMEARQVPSRIPPKPDNTSMTQAHEVYSILHSLIKEGAFRTNIPKLSVFSGEMVMGKASLEQSSYVLQTPGRHIVSQP